MDDTGTARPQLLADPPPERGGGRPRNPQIDAVVLAATRQLLSEGPYDKLTIEAVARRANVHRPVIYRRWDSLADLVHDAVYLAGDQPAQVINTGNFHDDLRANIRNGIALSRRPETLSGSPGLFAAVHRQPELRQRLKGRLEDVARADFERLIRGAITRGEARPLVTIETLFEVLAGTIMHHSLTLEDSKGKLEDELMTVLWYLSGAASLTARAPRARTRSTPRLRTSAPQKAARRRRRD